jgi:poly(A) polymerase
VADARHGITPPTPDEVTRAALATLGPGEAGWLVGGCLRDELLGCRVRDIDIAVDGDPEALARALADRLGGGVFITSDVFGAWRVVLGDLHIDVAALRGGPPGGTPDPATRAVRLEADLRGRDVTVDALARPLDGEAIVDPLSGLDDLAAGRLRLCSPTSLDDDPLRVLRLARLARVCELVPDAAATEAAVRAAPGLGAVRGERVRDALSSLLAARGAAVALRDLAVWGAFAVVLPEVDRLRGVEQNP